jgi:hypothetical protein
VQEASPEQQARRTPSYRPIRPSRETPVEWIETKAEEPVVAHDDRQWVPPPRGKVRVRVVPSVASRDPPRPTPEKKTVRPPKSEKVPTRVSALSRALVLLGEESEEEATKRATRISVSRAALPRLPLARKPLLSRGGSAPELPTVPLRRTHLARPTVDGRELEAPFAPRAIAAVLPTTPHLLERELPMPPATPLRTSLLPPLNSPLGTRAVLGTALPRGYSGLSDTNSVLGKPWNGTDTDEQFDPIPADIASPVQVRARTALNIRARLTSRESGVPSSVHSVAPARRGDSDLLQKPQVSL